ncbi:MAG: T9SS type A sorting domain-containing protein [Bacteroidia bacterium]|nr:T9SS type A sorting domain-containing protein [Bacteroidia bacterium]
MKKLLLLSTISLSGFIAGAQCTTSNATTCQCASQSQTNCDLLPDITVSWYALENYKQGPNEYPQVCVPACNGNDGRLRITASTPNIGFGPLTVMGSSVFVCGTDTFTSNPGTCPDGSTPRQLIMQRVYHKNGNTMTYWDRGAGAMTYHQSHGHNHVDDWGIFTLRINNGDPNCLNWPIVATGAKLGFCLMDYYQCSNTSANHHCKDVNTVYNQGTTLYNGSFPNFGLGGGSYNCSPVMQGISSGYTDVYDEDLDLMWINLPPGLCNGLYYIVLEVDPNNNFLESDETNNYTYIPFTLTQQNAPGNPVASITKNLPSLNYCQNNSITLTANAAINYLWNTGATTQSITVSNPGNYSVTMTNHCGTASASVTVTQWAAPGAPVASDDTICGPSGVATLTATGTGTLVWKDQNQNIVGLGNTFTTPLISSTTAYTVESQLNYTDTSSVGSPDNTYGVGAYSTSSGYLTFSVLDNMKLISVRILAQSAGTRTIELRDSLGALMQTLNAALVTGWNTVALNWNIAPGNAYRLVGAGGVSCYRNNNNATNFPYVLNGVVSINGSSSGPAYYYYFYDWKVETTNRYCSSTPVNVTAFVQTCTSISPEKDLDHAIAVFPNPSAGIFHLQLALPGTAAVDFAVYTLVGDLVRSGSLQQVTGMYRGTLDLNTLPDGVYMLTITIAGKSYYRKLVVN